LYIAEIAPEKIRGTLVALYQLAIVGGILVVFFVNLQIQRLGDEAWNTHTGWRWMFASLALPSGIFGL
jgi:SP family xylose:H+ symportor-like MFS transporter